MKRMNILSKLLLTGILFISFSGSANAILLSANGQLNIAGLGATATGGSNPASFVDATGIAFAPSNFVVGGTGDFSSLLPGTLVSFTDFDFDPFAAVEPLFSVGSFEFNLETLVVTTQTDNSLVIEGTGVLVDNDGNFLDTDGLFSLSANNNSNEPGATFIFSTVVDVPEPSTIALIGLGLIGLTCFRRRKS